MSIENLQAIFFDFDGVIVDSTHTKTEGFRALFSACDDEVVSKVVDYHQQHGGISRVDKIDYAHRNIIKRPLSQEDLIAWSARYSELVVEKVIAADWVCGAKEFLEDIKGLVPIFVISGTPEEELNHVISRRGIAAYFQEILGSPIRKPVHIRNLLRKYGLQSKRCVFVGDALTDYNAAAETGLTFIGIHSEVEFPAGTTVLSDCTGLQQAIAASFIC
jgi:HAD superfamily hydrolase (TIGR01549 family)